MDFICFDAETTDRGEILELSIHSLDCEEIYHQYFKPEHTRRWRTDIHHITPAMVRNMPSARRCVPEIQRIVDNAEYIIGFAVDNDVRILETAGIERLDSKRVIEVRQWYWYCIGRQNGMDINGGPGLSSVAAELGVELTEDMAHSASADTLATVRCFTILAERFREQEGIGYESTVDMRELVARFDDAYGVAREAILRERAHGALHLLNTPRGYRIIRNAEGKDDSIVASIEVADRYKAEYDLRKLFARRQSKDSPIHYILKPTDIEAFRNYTNVYDLDTSELCKRLLSRHERAPQLIRF